MSKITMAGNAAVITSAFTLEQMETIKKYRPKALTLMGGEDNKEPLFLVDVARGYCGEISNCGAVFGHATHDDKKLACMTICCTDIGNDAKAYAVDKFGGALMHLNALEAKWTDVLKEIEAEKAKIGESVTILA